MENFFQDQHHHRRRNARHFSKLADGEQMSSRTHFTAARVSFFSLPHIFFTGLSVYFSKVASSFFIRHVRLRVMSSAAAGCRQILWNLLVFFLTHVHVLIYCTVTK